MRLGPSCSLLRRSSASSAGSPWAHTRAMKAATRAASRCLSIGYLRLRDEFQWFFTALSVLHVGNPSSTRGGKHSQSRGPCGCPLYDHTREHSKHWHQCLHRGAA